ncbi:MAG: zinc-ribbon domain-containing protein [Clostridia bacterium]|nr:zinc-ribbon domain-containing protein [Clostridia bacterium]
MAKTCSKCGKEIADDATFCNYCGEKVGASNNTQWAAFNAQTSSSTEAYATEDIQANKVWAGLAYFLFFLPLIICPESRFARYHANQGLVLLIVSALGSIVLAIIPIIGWILSPIFGIAVLVLAIMGLVNGLNGQAKQLPLIGKWQVLH